MQPRIIQAIRWYGRSWLVFLVGLVAASATAHLLASTGVIPPPADYIKWSDVFVLPLAMTFFFGLQATVYMSALAALAPHVSGWQWRALAVVLAPAIFAPFIINVDVLTSIGGNYGSIVMLGSALSLGIAISRPPHTHTNR